MKTLYVTLLCLGFVCSSFAQIGKKKIVGKNLGLELAVKPGKIDLQNKTFPKGFSFKKLPELKVAKTKLELPTKRGTKITSQRLYSSNLKFLFHGRYNANYIKVTPQKSCSGGLDCTVHHTFFNGTITFNAQRGKEYRLKIKLVNNSRYSDGEIIISFNGSDYRVPVLSLSGGPEINVVFSASQAGYIYFAFTGINPWPDGSSWHELNIKSIQVDEI